MLSTKFCYFPEANKLNICFTWGKKGSNVDINLDVKRNIWNGNTVVVLDIKVI